LSQNVDRSSRKRGKKEQQHDTDSTDTRMILQGFTPANRKKSNPRLLKLLKLPEVGDFP